MEKLNLKDYKELILLLAIFCLLIFPVKAAHTMEDITEYINWQEGFIEVVGFGMPPENTSGSQAKLLSQRAAKIDAYRNALEIIKGVRVSSLTMMEDLIIKEDKTATKMDGFIRNAHFVDLEYNDDLTCKVKLILALNGQDGLSSVILDTVKDDINDKMISNDNNIISVSDKNKEVEIKNTEVKIEKGEVEIENKGDQVTERKKEKEKKEEQFTGVIIDTREFEVVPALYPQVFDQEGNLLYGPTLIKNNNQSFMSLVAYAQNQDESLNRTGKNPLIIKASSVITAGSQKPTDVILNSEDSKKITKLKDSINLLENYAVTFLIN